MPNYDFHCPRCEQSFERQLSIGARNDPQRCPTCGHEPVTRRMSAPGFTIHGYAAKNGYCSPAG